MTYEKLNEKVVPKQFSSHNFPFHFLLLYDYEFPSSIDL